MGGMSRLRRPVVSDRWFFITCHLLPRRRTLSEVEFACLAQVIHERREISFAPCGAGAGWGADFPTARARARRVKGDRGLRSFARRLTGWRDTAHLPAASCLVLTSDFHIPHFGPLELVPEKRPEKWS
jgi:hypothetical protein